MDKVVTRRPTKAVFKEFNSGGEESLEKWHDTFVEYCDPTEYTPAIELAGSWDEWCRFKKEWPEFNNVIVPKWVEEVEIKIRSKAIVDLVNKSKMDSSAARFLAEGKYMPKEVGRPSKQKIAREERIKKESVTTVEDEIGRVIAFVSEGKT